MENYENQQHFSKLRLLQHHHMKVNVSNKCISQKFFHQGFLDTYLLYEKSRYMYWVIYYLELVRENIKKFIFQYFQKIVIKVFSYNNYILPC